MPGPFAALANLAAPAINFLRTSPLGPVIILVVVLLVLFLVVLPLIGKLRRKRLKKKETRDIMKDLFTWRHLAQLVKGGEDHSKAKQDLSDNIVRINELLKEGFLLAEKNTRNLYGAPWFALLGEPLSGKSSLLAASELELLPSTEETNPEEDPNNSLPVRVWTGAKAVLYDVSGKVFFDRWLDGSSAEWDYIVRQICRRRRRKALDGVIITIPADALLADDDNLSSRKATLMASELGKLLQQSGMRLPCYVVVTKLDMVSGFQEYTKALSGDMRHQILGFESGSNLFDEAAFSRFRTTLRERLRSGAKQLIFPPNGGGGDAEENRMDRAGKIWLFPDTFDSLFHNLGIYLDILFGENNFHGTKDTVFEGVYFTSAKDRGFSFSPAVAALAERNTDDVLIPATVPVAVVPGSPPPELRGSPTTALVAVNAARTLLTPYLQRASLLRGYFIRDLLHRRIFLPSPQAEFVRSAALRRHIPQYALCAAMLLLGGSWLFAALFRSNELRVSLIQAETYYEWLDTILRKGTPFRSPLIKERAGGGFALDTEPVEGEALSSRLQFYYNALAYRDLKISSPGGFRFAEALVFRFDRNIGYRHKAFIANQLHKAMVRIPVIKSAGAKLVERIDTQVLDSETRGVILSFVSLDTIRGVDFYQYFASPQFRLDAMLRYLIPELSKDTLELLNSYDSRQDSPITAQMDIDYIYSDDYRRAKQAALDTVLSAWRRREVYPDSIYGKVRSMAAVSRDIAANYAECVAALNRINVVAAFPEVEAAVQEWRRLTDRHKYLAARGRAMFEEVRLLLRAAHIPMAFENSLPQANLSAAAGAAQGGGLLTRTTPDAFGNNLINDYLFNDLVIGYAVREYTRLFDADMEFLKRETRDGGSEVLGQIIAEQNTFSGSLHREVEELRVDARALQNNELLSQKLDEKPDSPSLFMAVERILTLASDMPLPPAETAQPVSFETGWQQSQGAIKMAMDAYEVFVKPYAENEKLSVLIANARVMMLAEAYYNRYSIFTTSLAFLNTFEGNIAAVIESWSDAPDLFSFSGNTIENLFGDFYYNKGYDPHEVKVILDNVASFAALFAPGEGAAELPLFLQNVDRRIYQPQPFMDYLASYVSYWGTYPDRVYVSAGTWERFTSRAAEYKSFQINSALLSIYAQCLEWINQIDNALLNDSLTALKTRRAASLGDSLSLLGQFFSADAEKMFAAWIKLPADPLEAYNVLRTLADEDLKASYLAVYTGGTESIGIGWWNSFVIDGVTLLARHADGVHMARLLEDAAQHKSWPLSADGPRGGALSLNTIRETALLFEAMGAGLPGAAAIPEGAPLPEPAAQAKPDPVAVALSHSLFSGSAARNWAGTLHQFLSAATNQEKPLAWTLHQPPADVQRRLPAGGRLLAIDRFRYVSVSVAGGAPRMSGAYGNEKTALLQGNPEDGDLVFRFYKTSRDSTPGAVVSINNRWAIFDLYLRRDRVADNAGNSYIPIYLADESGQYVYYVEVAFNAEIPGPQSWYSSSNWPDIMIVDGMIAEKR
jgi:hypothetical protein